MHAPYISKREIWKKADDFRNKYSKNKCPVEIIDIAEIDLRIRIFPLPNLYTTTGSEAFITSDFSMIYVEKTQYDHNNKNRLRFSVAHEIGHLILHKDFYESIGVRDLDSMLKFLGEIPDEQYSFLETHANEFAGRVLVEPALLRDNLEEAVQMIKRAHLKIHEDNLDGVIRACAQKLSDPFDVSPQVIETRILLS